MSAVTKSLLDHRQAIGMAVASRWAALISMDGETFVRGRSRDPDFSSARRGCYIELRALGWSYSMIGRLFDRDHSDIARMIHGRGATMETKEMPLDDYNDGPLTPSTHGALVNEERTHDAGVTHGRRLERQTICRKLLARAAEGKMHVDTEHTLRKLAALIESGEL
jgi:hypothetical protein